MKQDAIELKIQLIARGIKQRDIAKKANVDESTVSKVIHGKSKSKRISELIGKMIEI